MTFKHKLSARLARLRVGLPLFALAALGSCELQRNVAGLGDPVDTPVRLIVSPQAVMLDPSATVEFMAAGVTAAGDTVAVQLNWNATGGVLMDVSPAGSLYRGRYQAGALPGTYRVVVSAQPAPAASAGLFASPPTEPLADTAQVIITATTVPVATVVVTPSTASIAVGGSIQITATPQDAAGNALGGRVTTWVSGSPSVASVSGSGLVSGTATGSATITATSEGHSGTAVVTVTQAPVPVASVEVTPATATIPVSGTVQLTAVAKDASGNALSGRAMSWTSSSVQLATVAAGLVTGVGAGTARIVATSEGHTDTATITVTAAASVASVQVTPGSATLDPGRAVQLTATPADASGTPLSGRTITWASSNPSVAFVTPTGLVTALTAGSAQVTATCEGQSGTATITVTSGQTGPCGTSWPTAVHSPMPLSTGAEFYVSPSGSDANPGTITAPWRTLQKAFDALQPGQTAYLRAGTYGQKCSSTTFDRAGTATAPITVRGYPGERAVLNGQVRLDGSYMRLSYIIMEGPTCGTWGDGGKLGENMILMTPGSSHHIEVSFSEVFHGGWHAGISAGGDDIYVLNNYIHDNGNFNDSGQYNTSHGLYYHDGSRGLIANNIFEHNFAKGISARYTSNQIIVVNNTVVGNGRSGIDITEDTHDWIIANNIVANNGNVNGGTGVNTGGSSGGATNLVANNVMWNNGSSGDSHWNSNATTINNAVADPRLVSPANSVPNDTHAGYSNDYHLQSGSPAIDFASVAYALPIDLSGTCRPQGGGPDAGALERVP